MKKTKNLTPLMIPETLDQSPGERVFSEAHGGKENPGDLMDLMFRTAPVGLYMVENGALLRAASWLADLLGYEISEALEGKPFRELIHPEDIEAMERDLSLEDNPSGSVQQNVRVLKKDGSFIWMSLRENPMGSKGSSLKVGRFVEITPVKQLIDHQSRLN
ncbi:MAG: PAS domain S-box protein, partial [Proteobacteria bacterium]|nr:PAS domain S-box protein [Pseudomonadota bacterium]